MPLYDFRCPKCDKTVELLVRSDAQPACPTCGQAPMEKLVSKPAAPGQSADLVRAGRAQAKREGHFSNY
jgi:putative FmdB family regulatory protein